MHGFKKKKEKRGGGAIEKFPVVLGAHEHAFTDMSTNELEM